MDSLPYWIEQLSDSQFRLWIKVPLLKANSTTTLYIVKRSGYQPNGDSVFEFFDDFNGITKFEHLRGDGAYGFDNSMLYITGASDGMTAFQSPTLNLNTQFIVQAKVYAYDWNEMCWIGFSIEDTLGTNSTPEQIVKNGYEFGYWGWGGTKHSMRTFKDGGVAVNDHDAYEGFYSAQNGEYYYVGGTYDGQTLYHFKPTQDGSIVVDHQRDDTTFSESVWKRIAIGVWNGAKWGYDWILVRKYVEQEPIVSIQKIQTTLWKLQVLNPNNYDLTDFQIYVDVTADIVSSTTESLYITNLPTVYIFEQIDSISLSNTTLSLVKEVPQLEFKKRLKLYLTQNVDQPTDVVLHIPPNVEEFWQYRGQNLVLTDKDNKVLSFSITSESLNELYGIVYSLNGYTIDDVFYLYFDDGNERDTSNLVVQAVRPEGTISLEPRSQMESGSIVRFKYDFPDGFNNIRVFDTSNELPCSIIDDTVYVKLPYTPLNTLALYVYPDDSSLEFGLLDRLQFDATVKATLYESIDVPVIGEKLLLDGYPFAVIQKWIQAVPKTGIYHLEEAPTVISNYGNYTYVYNIILHIPNKQMLDLIETLSQKESISVVWNDEAFTGVVTNCNIQEFVTKDGKYWQVQLTIKRLYSVIR